MDAPYAIPEDVAALLGRALTDGETAMVGARLEQASAMVRTEVPSVAARLADGSLNSVVVAGVVADMVLRVVQNPRGVRSTQQAIDDYSTSETVDASRSEGALYLSDREVRLLRGRRGRAFTISPDPGPASCAPLWPGVHRVSG